MTGARLVVDDSGLSAGLTRLGQEGSDGRAFLEDVAGYLLFATQRRFETESGPDGAKWKALSPRTAAQRIGRDRARGTADILRVSTRLHGSILSDSDEREAAVGTNLVYAGIHQFGGDITQYPKPRMVRFRKKGKRTVFARASHKKATEKRVTFGQRTITIPARPYLGISEADRAEIEVILVNHMAGAAS